MLYLGFFISMTLLAFTPGPDILYTLSQTLTYGTRSGWAIIAGLSTGLIIHFSLLILGISLILRETPQALFLIKVIGVLYLSYLCWLTWQDYRNRTRLITTPAGYQKKHQTHKPWLYFYRNALLMNITNPKVLLFFLAFVPQFINQDNNPMHLSILAFLLVLSCIISFGTVTYLAHWSQQFLQQQKNQQKVQLVTFVAFITVTLLLCIDLILEINESILTNA